MNIRENVSLKPFNTFKVGGTAQFFCEIKSREELPEVARFLKTNNLPLFVLGGGSNVLISEKSFSGLVLKISTDGILWKELENEQVEIIADAGVSWDYLVSETVKRNLYGLENLSGIPGTVGAAPIQNIGAYGAEFKDVLRSVEIFDLKESCFKDLSFEDCEFGYRDSIFKKPEAKDWIVTKVFLLLSRKGVSNLSYKDLKNYFNSGPTPSLGEIREAVLKIRASKFPDLEEYGTAGSFFKNSIISHEKLNKLLEDFSEIPHFSIGKDQFKIPTAWILDNIFNLKDQSFGQVNFFQNQPLVVVNLGNASSGDIKKVTDKISFLVKEKLGIVLEREVTLVGEF